MLLVTATYSWVALFRHWHFESRGHDLGIFDQVLWHFSRFETPAVTIIPIQHTWANHLHPLLTPLAPLYWIFPGPENMLVAQSFLLAVSLVPVYLLSRSRFDWGPAALFTGAYALY